MQTVAKETGSYGAVLQPIKGRLPHVPVSPSLQPALERYVAEGWIDKDERYKVAPTVLAKGVATDFDIVSADEIRHNQFYQEFLLPLDLNWFAAVRLAAGGDDWVLSIQRKNSQGPFQPDELKMLVRLGIELAAPAAMAKALGFAKADGALAAFDLSATAAMMLSISGEVLKFNKEAGGLLGQDLWIKSRRLRSRSREASAMLDQAICHVLSRSDCPTSPAIPLPRDIGRPLIASVVRADSLLMEVLSPARAFILLVDQDKRIIPAIADLMGVFALTRAEGRLVVEMLRGVPLNRAAPRLGITYETARTTLKHIFRKTETSSQADLLSLISKLRASSSLAIAWMAQQIEPLLALC